MNALVDNYRLFVDNKVPRGAKLLGWFTFGVLHIYTLRTLAASSAQKQVKKIRAAELEGGKSAKKK